MPIPRVAKSVRTPYCCFEARANTFHFWLRITAFHRNEECVVAFSVVFLFYFLHFCSLSVREPHSMAGVRCEQRVCGSLSARLMNTPCIYIPIPSNSNFIFILHFLRVVFFHSFIVRALRMVFLCAAFAAVVAHNDGIKQNQRRRKKPIAWFVWSADDCPIVPTPQLLMSAHNARIHSRTDVPRLVATDSISTALHNLFYCTLFYYFSFIRPIRSSKMIFQEYQLDSCTRQGYRCRCSVENESGIFVGMFGDCVLPAILMWICIHIDWEFQIEIQT